MHFANLNFGCLDSELAWNCAKHFVKLMGYLFLKLRLGGWVMLQDGLGVCRRLEHLDWLGLVVLALVAAVFVAAALHSVRPVATALYSPPASAPASFSDASAASAAYAAFAPFAAAEKQPRFDHTSRSSGKGACQRVPWHRVCRD